MLWPEQRSLSGIERSVSCGEESPRLRIFSTRLSLPDYLQTEKVIFFSFFFFPLLLISETLRGSHLARAALSSVLIGCRTFRDAWMTVIPSTLVLVLNLSTSLLHQLAISSPSPLGPSYFSSDLLLRFQPTCCIGQRSSNTPYLNFVHLHAGFEIWLAEPHMNCTWSWVQLHLIGRHHFNK